MDARALCESFGLQVGKGDSATIVTWEDVDELALMGMTAWPLLGAAETDGLFALATVLVPEGGGPPLHRHACGELVAVMQGAIDYYGWRDGELVTEHLEAGSLAYSPAGAPHRFVAVGRPARLGVVMAPASGETVFLNLGQPKDGVPAGRTDRTDIERLDTVAGLPADTPNARFARTGDGERSWLLGDTVELFWDEPFAASIHELAVGSGAPLHAQVSDELFLVLDGMMDFTTISQRVGVTWSSAAGTAIHVPAGVGEGYTNALQRPCRFLLLCADARPHAFFRDAGLPLGAAPAPERAPEPAEVEAVIGKALAAGITFPTLP